MNKKMNPVVHFEMPYEDKDRVADFYSKAFGWGAQKFGPEMGDYVVAHTQEMDAEFMPKEKGKINGGFFKKTKPDQHPSVVIAVDDIQVSMREVEAAGGKIVGGQKPGEPDDIPGIGLYIAFTDTEGNRVGMLQPKEM
jgi:uncharacterized protein